MTNCPNQSWAKCCNHPSVSSQWLWVTSSPLLHHGKHTTLLGRKPCSFCLELLSLLYHVSWSLWFCGKWGNRNGKKGWRKIIQQAPKWHASSWPTHRQEFGCMSLTYMQRDWNNLCLRKNFPSASMPWRIVFGSVFYLFQTSKCKQLNKGRHNWS